MGVKDLIGDNKKFLLLLVLLVFVFLIGVYLFSSGLLLSNNKALINQKLTYDKAEMVLDDQYDYSIVISTVYGDITIDLYEKEAPESVNSLLFLIGERYYEGLKFHQVIKDFKLQAGDAKGDGEGNPGYVVRRENLISFKDYDVGMANASQFFIVLPNSEKRSFNGEYTVVGKVVEGFAVVDSIQRVEVNKNYKPINEVIIKSILIRED